MKPSHIGLICLTGSISGSTFLFLKIAVDDLPILTIAGFRLALGGIVLICVARILLNRWPRFPANWRVLIYIAMLGSGIPFPLQAWGTSFVPSGTAALVFATTPLITTLLVSLLRSDREFNFRFLLPSLSCGLLGVAVLIGPEAIETGHEYLLGTAILACAVFSVSCGAVELGRRMKDEDPVVLAGLQLAIAAVVVLPLGIVSLALSPPTSSGGDIAVAAAAVVTLGTLNSGVGYFSYTHLIVNAGPTAATYLTFLTPPIAVLLGAIVLGEELDWPVAASLALIAACLVMLTRSYRQPSIKAAELESIG